MSTCCCCFVLYLSGLTGSAYRACGRRLLPPAPWRYCRSWPGGSKWTACCDGPRASCDKGDRTVSGSCDVHVSGPGAPSLAVSHWHGAGECTVPEWSRVTDRPLRRHCREHCPAVLGSTEADWGDQTHHASEETCCFLPGCSPSACLSPWAPPYSCPRSHAAIAAIQQAAS